MKIGEERSREKRRRGLGKRQEAGKMAEGEDLNTEKFKMKGEQKNAYSRR